MRVIPHGTTLKDFHANNPFAKCNDSAHDTKETWTCLLISAFECDVIRKDGSMQTLRLALVMYLDEVKASDDVTGTGNLGWYDIIEIDRIIGPEHIVPCMQICDDEAKMYAVSGQDARDFRKRPITKNEKWTRVVSARNIGSAYPSAGSSARVNHMQVRDLLQV